jgi:hypothetical protein
MQLSFFQPKLGKELRKKAMYISYFVDQINVQILCTCVLLFKPVWIEYFFGCHLQVYNTILDFKYHVGVWRMYFSAPLYQKIKSLPAYIVQMVCMAAVQIGPCIFANDAETRYSPFRKKSTKTQNYFYHRFSSLVVFL